jgi:hypothetical protein
MPINTLTFVNLMPIDEILEEDRIDLDDYAFSIGELVDYFTENLGAHSLNPHNRTSFSEAAIAKMKNNIRLGEIITTFETQQAEKLEEIRRLDIIDPLIAMLNEMAAQERNNEEDYLSACSKIQRHFIDTHYFTLSPDKKAQLENYVIFVPLRNGGQQGMTFGAALAGGSLFEPCMIILQIYLWQFCHTVRPNIEIPNSIITTAMHRNLMLPGSEAVEMFEERVRQRLAVIAFLAIAAHQLENQPQQAVMLIHILGDFQRISNQLLADLAGTEPQIGIAFEDGNLFLSLTRRDLVSRERQTLMVVANAEPTNMASTNHLSRISPSTSSNTTPLPTNQQATSSSTTNRAADQQATSSNTTNQPADQQQEQAEQTRRRRRRLDRRCIIL